ncbi:trimeric intracellular cation channel family protein [Nisaea sp.]|uniref:trimeric intracellular cation channel family protein n=1 Tax=Nisaea sp. TaxID=2024842 RepID=UPI0032ED7D0D
MQDIVELSRLTFVMDMLAAVAFAISGSLVASRKGLDILGFMWLAILTGVGGGTVRDLVLDVPVFWVADPSHVIACLLTATVMFFLAPKVESRIRLVLWFDTLGLAFVTVVGTFKGLDHGTGPLIAVVMGVVTASVGGIVRDVVGNEESIILRREIYVTAAALGAITYVALAGLAIGRLEAAVAAFVVTFAVRAMAIIFNWSMPSYYRKPKTIDEFRQSRER